MRKQAEETPAQDTYDPHDFHRMWWSKMIAHHWNGAWNGRSLLARDLDRILATMALGAQTVAGNEGIPRTSFKIRDHFWRDLIRQGAREEAGGDSLHLRLQGIDPLVAAPVGTDCVLRQVLILRIDHIDV